MESQGRAVLPVMDDDPKRYPPMVYRSLEVHIFFF